MIERLKLQFPKSFEYTCQEWEKQRWSDYKNQDVIIVHAKDISYILNLYRDLLSSKREINNIMIVIEGSVEEFMEKMKEPMNWFHSK
ncbi:MAG TPA: hypothetical protein VIY08_00805 [Candidatus Nitrosocosmicus sp.]